MRIALVLLLFLANPLLASAQIGGPGGFDRVGKGTPGKADLSVAGYHSAMKMGYARLKLADKALSDLPAGQDPETRYRLAATLGTDAWEVAELCQRALDSQVLAKELEEAGRIANALPGIKLKTWQDEFGKCVVELRQVAIAGLQQAVDATNTAEGRDELLFQLGYFQAVAGTPAAGAETMGHLLEEYPQSIYVPEAWLMVGEFYFDQQLLDKALAAYQQVDLHQTARVRPYAKYKSAWVLYNLQQFDQAYKTLVTALDMCGPGSPWNHLQDQVTRDVSFFFAAAGTPEEAVERFQKIDLQAAQSMAERLSALYADQGRYDDSLNVLEALVEAYPDSDKVLTYRRLQVVNVRQMGDANALVVAVEMLAREFSARAVSHPAHSRKAAPAILEMLEEFIADYRIQANKGTAQARETADRLSAIKETFQGE
jgi:tetratricopeptide (TPR) repeat protein